MKAESTVRRTAFTLLEILLVMGILVAVAAIAVPSVTRSFDRQSLTKAADRVRIAMGRARVAAIRTGEVQALSYLPGTGWLQVSSLAQASSLAATAQRRAEQQRLGLASNYEDDLLPGQCVFADAAVEQDDRSQYETSTVRANDSAASILFYPDGTSQNARLRVRNASGQVLDVSLRGLTGTATTDRRSAQQRNANVR